MSEAPVAPDKVRHHLLKFQGPRLEKTLLFLRALTLQRQEKTAHEVSKRVPKRARMQKTHTFAAFVFKLDFEVP